MIESMGGRIFNTGGDSVFAEFGSAVQPEMRGVFST